MILMVKKMVDKHNCCKENDFSWKSINPFKKNADILICDICRREFKSINNGFAD